MTTPGTPRTVGVRDAHLRPLLALSVNTFREAVRNKIFGSMLSFGVLLLLFSLILGEMSLHHEVRVTRTTTIFASTLFTVLIAVYSSVTLLQTEFERRTVYTLLTKPIHRWHFLLGKFIGVQALTACVLVCMNTVTALLLWIRGEPASMTLLAASLAIFLQAMIITALAIFFSCFASSLWAGLTSALMFVAGHLFSQLETIRKLLQEQENPLAHVVSLFEVILPNLESLNLSAEFTYNAAVPWSYLGAACVYAGTYAMVVFLLAVAVFSRKDLG